MATSTGLPSSGSRGAETPYEAVRAIEEHLRGDFAYTPTSPEHTCRWPRSCSRTGRLLPAVRRLDGPDAEDAGDPGPGGLGVRPGPSTAASGAYEVRDFDAHSWVEVYFRGIGWVTFDPTPGAAPADVADASAASSRPHSAAGARRPITRSRAGALAPRRRGAGGVGDAGPGTGPGDRRPWSCWPLIVVGGAVAGGGLAPAPALAAAASGSTQQVDELALGSATARLGAEPGRDADGDRAPRRPASAAGRVRGYAARCAATATAAAPAPPGPAERRAAARAPRRRPRQPASGAARDSTRAGPPRA